MADLPEPPLSIFALSTRATSGFEEELGVFLQATRLRWAEAEEGDREALLRDASNELMSRFHGELEELARVKLGALPSREHYPVSEGFFVDGFYMKVLRNPERLLGVDVEDGTVDVHRRVFLGGFYQAMGRAVVDRGRRERVAARKGQDERPRPMLRDLDQRAEGRENAEAAAHEFEEERELVLQKPETSTPRAGGDRPHEDPRGPHGPRGLGRVLLHAGGRHRRNPRRQRPAGAEGVASRQGVDRGRAQGPQVPLRVRRAS